jgi:Domain of unknown function (DUF397)
MDYLDGLTWRKSSYSGSNGGNCIEVAAATRAVAVRDSKDPHGPVLAFGSRDWQRFADQVRRTHDSA